MLFEKQQYQEDCVNNIIAVLKDSHPPTDFRLLRTNLEALHEQQDIPIKHLSDDRRLDILMETGTGKTFTYLKTMFEMNKVYGVNKFVLFVPRVAIREGVIQNIKLTSQYFKDQYNKHLGYYTYDGKVAKGVPHLGSVKLYTFDEFELSLLILTAQSITSNGELSRILTRRHEMFEGRSPLKSIGALNPVVFIDEPHLLKGNQFVKAYKKHFENSLLLRFGATYPTEPGNKLSNVVYVLDSVTSFRSRLVKRIRVSTIHDSRAGIRFTGRNKDVRIIYQDANQEEQKSIKTGEDIGVAIGNTDYAGVRIVSARSGTVSLSNGKKYSLKGRLSYNLVDDTMRAMIKSTIESHFKREERLFKQGIKTLSLFFIPGIDDFRGDNPRVKLMFEEEYTKQRTRVLKSVISDEYRAYLNKDYDGDNLLVHGGYFSGDGGGGNNSDNEARGVDLILRGKAQLLSTSEPLRFIFSVWALQEGWDNPNIFNICKLAPSDIETSRRQQVGRGLRLAINQQGVRQTMNYCEKADKDFYGTNTLDVIVSSQEGNFIRELQGEINENSFVFGGDRITIEGLRPQLNQDEALQLVMFLKDKGVVTFSTEYDAYIINNPVAEFIKDNRTSLPRGINSKYDEIVKIFENTTDAPVVSGNKQTDMVGIRANRFKEFEELWNTITRKAEILYGKIDEDDLVNAVNGEFQTENIDKTQMVMTTEAYDHDLNGIKAKGIKKLGDIDFSGDGGYAGFILKFAKNENLPIIFVSKLFGKLDRQKIGNDPAKAYSRLREIVNEAIHRSVIQSVGYNFESDIRIESHNVFYNDDGSMRTEIEAGKIGRYTTEETPADHYLYDRVLYDSNIEKKASVRETAYESGACGTVQVFAKLPRISIPTPYKTYSPDFAYFIKTDQGKKIFFVAETKGYDSDSAIPPDEKLKVKYAKKFFEKLDMITGEDIEVVFEQRINKQSMLELLEEIRKP